MTGHALFAQYAYPPNELGYCGPTDNAAQLGHNPTQLASHAKEFDGAWPYLAAIADAVAGADPLDEDVGRSYWVGGRAASRERRSRPAPRSTPDRIQGSSHRAARRAGHVDRGAGAPQLSRLRGLPLGPVPASRSDDRGARDAG